MKNRISENVRDTVKAVLREKYIAANTYIKEERSQINRLTSGPAAAPSRPSSGSVGLWTHSSSSAGLCAAFSDLASFRVVFPFP